MSIVSSALQWLGLRAPPPPPPLEWTHEPMVVVVPPSRFKVGDRVAWPHAMGGKIATGAIVKVFPYYGGYNQLYVRPDNEPTVAWHVVAEMNAVLISSAP